MGLTINENKTKYMNIMRKLKKHVKPQSYFNKLKIWGLI